MTVQSWISNGSVRSHGLKSRTYEAPHTSNRHTRLRFAPQQAQHAILRAIVHNGPSSPTLESATPQQLAPLGPTSRERL